MQVTPIGVVTGIFIGVITGVIVERYRHRLRRKQTADEWYGKALGLISRAERIGHRTTEFQQETDTDTLRSKLDPLSEDLREHAADAPSVIPEEARNRLKFLSDITTGLVIISEQADEMTGPKMLANLQKFTRERVEKGNEFPDIDQLNEIIARINTDAMAEDIPVEDVSFDEEDLEELLGEVSDETLQKQQIQSLDDALNFPFEEADELIDEVDLVDEVMDGGMREYVRLWLLEITDDFYRDMESRRKMV